MSQTQDWTTLLDPQLTKMCGQDIHNVYFLPLSEAVGRCVGLLIPECELHFVVAAADGAPVCYVNRPKHNNNMRRWLRFVCTLATENDCPLSFACDTHEQAERAATMAAKRLPNHRRIALERMYKAETRTFRGLS